MTFDQLDIETVDVPTFVTTPPPGLTFPDPAYPLAGTLRAIGCSCFSRCSVGWYRDEVVRRAKRQAQRVENRIDAFEANLTAKPADLLLGWGAVLYVWFCAGALISIPVAFVTTSVMPFTVVGWGGAAGLLLGVATACLNGLQVYRTQNLPPAEVDARRAALAEEVESVPVLTWAETPLAENWPAASSAVYSLAWKVHGACPDARLIVHHTVDVRVGNVDRDRGLRNRTDSFLGIRLGDESYFIAAWNEKEHRIAWAWTARC